MVNEGLRLRCRTYGISYFALNDFGRACFSFVSDPRPAGFADNEGASRVFAPHSTSNRNWICLRIKAKGVYLSELRRL